MIERDIQFMVTRLKPYCDCCIVTGVCIGDTLMIGGAFTTMYEELTGIEWQADAFVSTPIELSLSIESIRGTDPEFVDPGGNATLIVTGVGMERIVPEAVLANHRQKVLSKE